MVQVFVNPGNWSFDACQLHVETVLHWHCPSVRQPRELELFVHFADELFVGHSRPPLPAGLQHDGGVVHIERRVVGRAIRATHCTKNCLNFGEALNDAVLLLKKLRRLRDGNSG